MNYSIYRFTLDIHKTKSQVSIPVMFHDTGIKLYISLTDGGKPYFVEDGCIAVFSAKKHTGEQLFNYCIIEDNTRLRYDFTEQTTNSEGMMNCEIRLYGKDGKLITTPAFVVVVDPRVIKDDDVLESCSESTVLDNIVFSEMERIAGEQLRIEAEEARKIAEEFRSDEEAARRLAEMERSGEEFKRAEAEAERQKAFESMMSPEEIEKAIIEHSPVTYGAGSSSIVQRQGGAITTDGTPYKPSTADGISATSLGAGNNANGACGFIAGHGNTTYQYDAASFGGGNVVGNKERQELYEAVLDFADGDTVLEKSIYLLNNWDAFKSIWNEGHPDKQIGQPNYRDFCHLYKFSCGLAGGLDNILEGRAAGVIGTYNNIPGENSYGLGNNNYNSGRNSLIGGEYCYNTGNNNLLLGLYLESRGGHNKFICGKYNLDKTDQTLWEVGNGTANNRKNAFEVRVDGSAYVEAQGLYDNSVVIRKTLSGYLPVVASASEFSHRVYGVNSKGGQIMYQATNGYAANTVAKRDARGGCQFADPQYAQDAATKNYVDNKFANGITVGSTFVSEAQLKKLLALLS